MNDSSTGINSPYILLGGLTSLQCLGATELCGQRSRFGSTATTCSPHAANTWFLKCTPRIVANLSILTSFVRPLRQALTSRAGQKWTKHNSTRIVEQLWLRQPGIASLTSPSTTGGLDR